MQRKLIYTATSLALWSTAPVVDCDFDLLDG